MKIEEIIAMALAGVALWMVLKSGKAIGAQPISASNSIFPKEIFTQAQAGQPGFGWRYFTDGTVIDPDGAYWKDNRIVWAPGLNEAY